MPCQRSPSGVPPLGPPYMPQRRNAIWLPRRSNAIVLTEPSAKCRSTSPLCRRWVSGSKRMRCTRLVSVRTALARVAEVVEHVVAPDAEVRELDPLAAVRVLHAHVAPGPADAVAGSPVVVAGAEVGVGAELEALAVRLDPALLAAEAVVAGDGAHGAAADDDAGAQLAEDGPLRIEPVDLEGDREVRAGAVRSAGRGGAASGGRARRTSKLKGPSRMSMRSLRSF